MSQGGHRQAPAVVSAFLLKFLEDRERGEARSLVDYQAMFPGYEDVVEREHRKLVAMYAAPGQPAPESSSFPPGVELPPAAAPAPVTPSLSTIVHELRTPAGDPRQIGVYRVIEAIGKGGMGVVYLAEQTEPIRRRVALKVIKLGMDTREVLARFDTERQALALMNHPHIARVYDAGATDHGRPFFVMEHVPGIPLGRFCDQHVLDTRSRLELFLQICQAMQHAHQKGIIHRDLKPSNILVAYEDGKPLAKIIDFGVAKSTSQRLSESTVYTEQGQIIGTPEYMSPEQAEMSALDVDTRTDIYSLGVILYELLTGTLPFDSKELRSAGYAELQRRIREVETPSPSTRLSRLGEAGKEIAQKRRTDPRGLLRQVRGDLDWIALKALEKDRARRFASASELAADIERHLRHEPILARPPGVLYRASKLARRHRRGLVTVAVAAALCLVGLLTLRHWQARGHLEEAIDHRGRLRDLRQELGRLEEQGREARGRLQSWRPPWELTAELELLAAVEGRREELERLFHQATLALHQARQAALPVTGLAQRAELQLGELYFERTMDIFRGRLVVEPEMFQGMVESQALESFGALLADREVSLSSEPPGAEVFCFRHEPREGRLLPLPFEPAAGHEDPGQGLRGESRLLVDRVSAGHLARPPFAPGDQLLHVAGSEVKGLTDLARSLASLAADQEVSVAVLRGGGRLDLGWTPFPESLLKSLEARSEDEQGPGSVRPGKLFQLHDQLGFTLVGYPLAPIEACRIGSTRLDTPLRVRLPRGSYLFLLRKEGCNDVRVPIRVPFEEEGMASNLHVKLLRPADIPPGFAYIPEGFVAFGGDRGVDEEGLVGGAQSIPGFFLARLELTVKEYLEFLNDPAVSARTDDDGLLPSKARPGRSVLVAPHYLVRASRQETVTLLCQRDPSARTWRYNDMTLSDDAPALGISVDAAREYAAWRSEKDGRWRYRLPTDLEWEKAARGVDRRPYVWGDHPILSFCRSYPGRWEPTSKPGRVGTYPMDESVYGVRDLAGSVTEPVEATSSLGFPVFRGGSYRQADAAYYRIANREGRRSGVGLDTGVRLAADLR